MDSEAPKQPDLLLRDIEELRCAQSISPTRDRAAKIKLYEDIYKNGELLRAFVRTHSSGSSDAE